MTRIFAYATWGRLSDWLALGWMVIPPNRPTHHDVYGPIVEWRCQCKVPRPIDR